MCSTVDEFPTLEEEEELRLWAPSSPGPSERIREEPSTRKRLWECDGAIGEGRESKRLRSVAAEQERRDLQLIAKLQQLRALSTSGASSPAIDATVRDVSRGNVLRRPPRVPAAGWRRVRSVWVREQSPPPPPPAPSTPLHLHSRLWTEAKSILEKGKHLTENEQVVPAFEEEVRTDVDAGWGCRVWSGAYCDLATEERANRALLRWVLAVRGDKPQKGEDTHEGAGKRVALICGGVGVGKSSLASACLAAAGYRARELLADERTPQALLAALRSAATHATTLHADRKPTAILLEEMEMCGPGVCEALVRWAEGRAGGGGKASRGGGGGGRGRATPVIAVCNDLYAPVLQPLRRSPGVWILRVEGGGEERVVAALRRVLPHLTVERARALARAHAPDLRQALLHARLPLAAHASPAPTPLMEARAILAGGGGTARLDSGEWAVCASALHHAYPSAPSVGCAEACARTAEALGVLQAALAAVARGRWAATPVLAGLARLAGPRAARRPLPHTFRLQHPAIIDRQWSMKREACTNAVEALRSEGEAWRGRGAVGVALEAGLLPLLLHAPPPHTPESVGRMVARGSWCGVRWACAEGAGARPQPDLAALQLGAAPPAPPPPPAPLVQAAYAAPPPPPPRTGAPSTAGAAPHTLQLGGAGKGETTAAVPAGKLAFVYREGVNNAVRRAIRISALL